ncbi:MAG: hypothetical protein QHH80_04550 [Anaerolineae bacterium]|nr:hypothetical protein [Anaerolineae bacterium]
MRKTKSISHTWRDETPEAKARWFQSLSVAERLDLLCWFTDLALAANPRIMEQQGCSTYSRPRSGHLVG